MKKIVQYLIATVLVLCGAVLIWLAVVSTSGNIAVRSTVGLAGVSTLVAGMCVYASPKFAQQIIALWPFI